MTVSVMTSMRNKEDGAARGYHPCLGGRYDSE
jgi:hypothetical protein